MPETAFKRGVLGGCSLLGAVRSDDLIPWTNDVDIAVPAYVLSKLMVCLLLWSSLYLTFRQSLPQLGFLFTLLLLARCLILLVLAPTLFDFPKVLDSQRVGEPESTDQRTRQSETESRSQRQRIRESDHKKAREQ